MNFHSVLARDPCVHRDFGNGATVCVCNATYCDDLEPIKKTTKGVITLFETSKKGDRFKESALKFGDTHSEHVTKTQTITIDKTKKLQKIIGFGGAFTGLFPFARIPESIDRTLYLKFLLNQFPNENSLM
jgi:hypothetical protein